MRKIRVASVDGWWSSVLTTPKPAWWRRHRLANEFRDVVSGRAMLVLPDGSEYFCPVDATLAAVRVDATIAAVLINMLMDHAAGSCSGGVRPDLPRVLFNRRTLDSMTAYCLECVAYINLRRDAAEVEERRAQAAAEE